jgi:hypothetical protein
MNSVHRRLRARIREAPLREPEPIDEFLGDHDRAVGRRGEVGAEVVAGLDRIADRGIRVPDAHDAEPVVEVDVLAPVDVPDPRSLTSLQIDRPWVVLLKGGGDASRHHLDAALVALPRLRRVFRELVELPLGELGDAAAVDGRGLGGG